MRIINGFKVNMYVRIGDQPPKNWEEFTKEEQREISQKLNEQQGHLLSKLSRPLKRSEVDKHEKSRRHSFYIWNDSLYHSRLWLRWTTCNMRGYIHDKSVVGIF